MQDKYYIQMHFTVEFSIIQVHFDNDILKDVIKGILRNIKHQSTLKCLHDELVGSRVAH